MISEEEARARILDTIKPLPERAVPLAQALGWFAAQGYFARLPLPVFDNSAMDGYAVVASACKKGARLRVTGEQPAGRDRQLRVSPGEAARIFTGAPMPSGADAIVMQEDVTRDRDEIAINTDVEAGEFIRQRGCDLAEGQRIVAKGERIRSRTRPSFLSPWRPLRSLREALSKISPEIFRTNALTALCGRLYARDLHKSKTKEITL